VSIERGRWDEDDSNEQLARPKKGVTYTDKLELELDA